MPNIPKGTKRPWLARKPKQNTEARKERNKFYKTKRWRDLRLMFIRQQPLCVECGVEGKVVDHIKPIRLGGAPLDWDNLQTMCHRCHNAKSGRETHLK